MKFSDLVLIKGTVYLEILGIFVFLIQQAEFKLLSLAQLPVYCYIIKEFFFILIIFR